MKRLCIILLLGVFQQALPGQSKDCPLLDSILLDVERLLKQESYVKALDKLNAAREYCPDKSKDIEARTKAVVLAIERKKSQADEALKKANTLIGYFKFGKEKFARRREVYQCEVKLPMKIYSTK